MRRPIFSLALVLAGCSRPAPSGSPSPMPPADATPSTPSPEPPVDLRAAARPSPGLPASGFEVGEPFPDIALPRLDGSGPGRMADFRGQKTILHIFASW